jgi:hypothetical protein
VVGERTRPGGEEPPMWESLLDAEAKALGWPPFDTDEEDDV